VSAPVITIDWLNDEHDCETCGGSYAEGARVLIDKKIAFTLEPVAHCFNGVSYSEWQVYHRLLQHFGYDVPRPTWASDPSS
jgi:hypothetical protein